MTIDEWLIGAVFLKNVYSVYDFGTNAATGGRIGFAQLVQQDLSGGGGVIGVGSGVNTNGGLKSGGKSRGDGSRLLFQAGALVVASALMAMF